MPKKRKTRQQKERKQQHPKKPAPTLAQKTGAPVVDEPAIPATSPKVSIDPDGVEARRKRTMKLSLAVFAVLAVLQLGVWWSLRSGVLPESWVELLLG